MTNMSEWEQQLCFNAEPVSDLLMRTISSKWLLWPVVAFRIIFRLTAQTLNKTVISGGLLVCVFFNNPCEESKMWVGRTVLH